MAADLQRVFEHIHARHRDAARGRGNESRQDSHRRALARAVRSEEADNLPAFYLERHVLERGHAREPLRQILNSNHRLHEISFRRKRKMNLSKRFRLLQGAECSNERVT